MRVFYFLLFLLVSTINFVLADDLSRFNKYFSLYSDNDSQEAYSELVSFAGKLEKKQGAMSEQLFLETLFTKTHSRFLKSYEANADFDDIGESGMYNCLTGTALYAILLDHFGFKFRIIETNYHIFLLVETASGEVLFEATDPAHGFLSDQHQIEKRVSHYRLNRSTQAEPDKNYYHYSFGLYKEVSMKEVAGLLLYNKAIEAFNLQQFQTAVAYLDQTIQLYNSQRIAEFTKIVLFSVVQSKLDASVKASCVKKIQSIRQQKIPAIAGKARYNP